MPETEEEQQTEEQSAVENKNIRNGTDEEWELPEPPYFYSPYPDSLVQVHTPDTRGGKEVARLINKHWPATIEELVDQSKDEFEDGYSGSFIRNVLRNNYAPADHLEQYQVESDKEKEEFEAPTEELMESTPDVEEVENMSAEEEAWHKVFRMDSPLHWKTKLLKMMLTKHSEVDSLKDRSSKTR